MQNIGVCTLPLFFFISFTISIASPKAFRWLISHVAMAPYVVAYRLLSVIIGKRSARSIVGRLLTKFRRSITSGFSIDSPSRRVSCIQGKAHKAFASNKKLYDIRVEVERSDRVEFKTISCPLATTLKNLGASELSKFACAADFIIANRNRDKWKFRRTHSHGTDGLCCNHTYMALDSTDA